MITTTLGFCPDCGISVSPAAVFLLELCNSAPTPASVSQWSGSSVDPPDVAGGVARRFREVREEFIYLDFICPFGHEMSKRKTYRIFLALEDRIDVDLEFQRRSGTPPRLFRFALTYSAWLAGRWREVVRYDNFHGYLHRQPFWRTREPERLRDLERRPMGAVLDACREDLRRNWRRYRSLMESTVRED